MCAHRVRERGEKQIPRYKYSVRDNGWLQSCIYHRSVHCHCPIDILWAFQRTQKSVEEQAPEFIIPVIEEEKE